MDNNDSQILKLILERSDALMQRIDKTEFSCLKSIDSVKEDVNNLKDNIHSLDRKIVQMEEKEKNIKYLTSNVRELQKEVDNLNRNDEKLFTGVRIFKWLVGLAATASTVSIVVQITSTLGG